jgi:hypothetical protein
MSDQRRAYRDLSLGREELFEERYRKAADALARVEAELKSRDEDQAARDASLRREVNRYAGGDNAHQIVTSWKTERLGYVALLAFAVGFVTVPAVVGLIALIRAIF